MGAVEACVGKRGCAVVAFGGWGSWLCRSLFVWFWSRYIIFCQVWKLRDPRTCLESLRESAVQPGAEAIGLLFSTPSSALSGRTGSSRCAPQRGRTPLVVSGQGCR